MCTTDIVYVIGYMPTLKLTSYNVYISTNTKICLQVMLYWYCVQIQYDENKTKDVLKLWKIPYILKYT